MWSPPPYGAIRRSTGELRTNVRRPRTAFFPTAAVSVFWGFPSLDSQHLGEIQVLTARSMKMTVFCDVAPYLQKLTTFQTCLLPPSSGRWHIILMEAVTTPAETSLICMRLHSGTFQNTAIFSLQVFNKFNIVLETECPFNTTTELYHWILYWVLMHAKVVLSCFRIRLENNCW
jgi:hypothetical protein